MGVKARWPGGNVHRMRDGRDLFIIERKVGKKRFHISTRCHSYGAAMKHLERFEADPFSYSPVESDAQDALEMTAELVLEYREWQITKKGNTRKHANEMTNRLKEWLVDLRGVDLRKATMAGHIGPALELANRSGSHQHRIIAIKGFYGWLRKKKRLLRSSEDPTLDLPVPAPRPAKGRRKRARPKGDVVKVLKALAGPYRDCLLILANTGLHVSELQRLVRGIESELIVGRAGGPLGIIAFPHKTGDQHAVAITSKAVLTVIQRMRARGEMPRKFSQTVKAACRVAKVPEFGPGDMRHSYATWAVESGLSPKSVSMALGHRDESTTRRFYIDTASTAVPLQVAPILPR